MQEHVFYGGVVMFFVKAKKDIIYQFGDEYIATIHVRSEKIWKCESQTEDRVVLSRNDVKISISERDFRDYWERILDRKEV